MAATIETDQPMTIGVLAIDGFAMMCYASTVEPLRAANLLAGARLYNVVHVSEDGSSAVSSLGASAPPSVSFQEKLDYDVMLVIAGSNPIVYQNKVVFDWLRRQARSGVVMGGISGGPAILANAGLMEGKRMTIHWDHASIMAELSPSLMIERSLYVMDRDRITCAGGSAPMDLMHAMIATHHGAEFARKVSDWFLHTEIRHSNAPQKSGKIARYGTHNRAVLDAIELMENHLGDTLTLEQLTRFTQLSKRQLNRLFFKELNTSPMRFYREMRLEKARNLLQNSALSLTEVALATGFANSAHFSTAFSNHYGIAPSKQR